MKELDRLNLAVDEFAAEMKKKLRAKHREGFRGWEWPSSKSNILLKAKQHLDRLVFADAPQEVDVANLVMMVWNIRRKRKVMEE